MVAVVGRIVVAVVGRRGVAVGGRVVTVGGRIVVAVGGKCADMKPVADVRSVVSVESVRLERGITFLHLHIHTIVLRRSGHRALKA